MSYASKRNIVVLGWFLAAVIIVGCGRQTSQVQNTSQPTEKTAAATQTPKSGEGEKVKLCLCDGETSVDVPADLKGRELAATLLDQWKRNHPQATWVAEEQQKHSIKPPADNSHLIDLEGDTYGTFTKQDILTWARETEKFVAEGSRIFHNSELLGSTVAVSCDMCHPNAANTHPETYPKFQTQLGRVALLRDMINWCVEHPVRGTKLDPDGPTMRALEAYIHAERKGVAMDYGKH